MHDSHLPLRKWFSPSTARPRAARACPRTSSGAPSASTAGRPGTAATAAARRSATRRWPAPRLSASSRRTRPSSAGRSEGRGRGRRGKDPRRRILHREGGVRLERVPNTKRTTLHATIQRPVEGKGGSRLHRRAQVLPRHRRRGHPARDPGVGALSRPDWRGRGLQAMLEPTRGPSDALEKPERSA